MAQYPQEHWALQCIIPKFSNWHTSFSNPCYANQKYKSLNDFVQVSLPQPQASHFSHPALALSGGNGKTCIGRK